MRRLWLAIAALLAANPALAGDAATEIEFLLTAIGNSRCTFVRNGREHSAEDAEDHLRMKYRRGKRHASTAEKFIDRLASKSSMSRKPYLIDCPGAAPVATGAWLHARLHAYRSERK